MESETPPAAARRIGERAPDESKPHDHQLTSHLAFFPSTPQAKNKKHIALTVLTANQQPAGDLNSKKEEPSSTKQGRMSDWGPVVIAVVLFVLLSPGLLFQLPGRCSFVDFGNLHTSAASIVVHSIIFFALIAIFVIVIGVHITTGDQPAY
ncbi:hypothetical protein GQ55_3G139500 [Panicum hallii var. hallii]|uniref:Uncharacterized protein n=2 Tax=Panicum sect. Panicum TaxID=2100772 RepID=A0A2T7E979_9POAL|nr:hypothetical protein GQ55_3G139500 [Panicum hallii var. hallii]